MTAFQRFGRIATGALSIIGALIILLVDELGYLIVCLVIGITLLVSGIRMLIGYFSLNRFMVGGKRKLYLGIIVFDLGMFTLSLSEIPRIYIALYLVVIHVFAGFIDVLHARESKKYGGPKWKFSLASGVANILVGIACLIFIRDIEIVILIFAGGLIYSSVVRIASAFRRTAIVYIQ